MNILDFISELRLIDIIILIFIIFIFMFLLFLTISLLKKNKLLRQELSKINIDDEDKSIIIKPQEEQLDLPKIESNINNNIPTLEENIDEILEDLPEIPEVGPYRKNILRELNTSGQTSPVNIGKSTVDVPKVKVTSYVKPKEQIIEKKIEDKKEKSITEVDNQTFIEEISKRMEQELEPQTIELTDYEKKQEEEAIISYQELLKAKDRMYKITDDEEINSFIDELKEFRTNLKE